MPNLSIDTFTWNNPKIFIPVIDVVFDRVRADFKASCNGEHNPSISSVSKLLKVTNWEVHYGPLPSSIYWYVQQIFSVMHIISLLCFDSVYCLHTSALLCFNSGY